MSEDSNESVHILKVKEKRIEEKEDTDGYEHSVSTGEYFLRGKYLKMRRSRSTTYYKFSILHGDVLCTLEEVFETFPDISDHLTLDKKTFIALQIHAGAL